MEKVINFDYWANQASRPPATPRGPLKMSAAQPSTTSRMLYIWLETFAVFLKVVSEKNNFLSIYEAKATVLRVVAVNAALAVTLSLRFNEFAFATI